MAAVTIRNLADEVVAALKERARRNARSMEAEVRDVLTRLADGEELRSGLEDQLARQVNARRFSVPASEVMARIAANPPTEEERRTARVWAEELDTYRGEASEEALRDPWERADELLDAARRRQASRK
ncbi:plasmid stabilization protein [Microbacterium sp. CH12i]|uniref:FitA-like ribbon-helix-helix domain-containing protein n=1 Tax=Microbacterium sp. CH12i TaxID=1479651 RepID=UPI00046104D7|nr:hypothetical protein [Microbacterium sp. CH12i]KDA05120.1 plasmid stabilization protein [Microbacterium sp. CH12i]